MSKTKVAVIVGSLRKGSFSRMTARALIKLAPAELNCALVEIGDLPLYNEDLETETPPEAWTRFRDELKASAAVLLVSPEYNRSIPGCLKNAIDVASRPRGQAASAGRPVAVVTVSPGALGGFGANHHLRQTLVFLDMPPMQQPEAYISHVGQLFDDAGELKLEDTRTFFGAIMTAFAKHISRGPEL